APARAPRRHYRVATCRHTTCPAHCVDSVLSETTEPGIASTQCPGGGTLPTPASQQVGVSALQDGGDALSACRADGDQTTAGAVLGQQLRQCGGDPATGGGERVSRSNGRTVHVQPRSVDRTGCLVEAEPVLGEIAVLPGLQRGQHLRGERLVDLVEVE